MPAKSSAARPTSFWVPGAASVSGRIKWPPGAGWEAVPAVRDGELHEIKSPIILQPGPAALTDGLDAIHRVLRQWSTHH